MLSRNRFERDILLTAVRVPMLAAVALGFTFASSAFGQSSPSPASPASPAPSAPTYPPPPPQGYPQPAPGYPPQQPPPGYQPAYQQPPPPGYQQQPPPPGYQQQPPPPGYQQQPPPPGYQQQPPPQGYQQPGYPPAQPPAYGQPYPGYGQPAQPYPVIPLPPPPQRNELKWSLRFNAFDLLLGRVTAEVEYAITGPVTLTLAPQYIFGDPRQDRTESVTAKGYGFYGELGFWMQGTPLRGYYLKAHIGHATTKFKSEVDADVDAPETLIGAVLGSQAIYGGWFTFNWGFLIAYDTQSEDRWIRSMSKFDGHESQFLIPASGIFGNGLNLLPQLGLGGSF